MGGRRAQRHQQLVWAARMAGMKEGMGGRAAAAVGRAAAAFGSRLPCARIDYVFGLKCGKGGYVVRDKRDRGMAVRGRSGRKAEAPMPALSRPASAMACCCTVPPVLRRTGTAPGRPSSGQRAPGPPSSPAGTTGRVQKGRAGSGRRRGAPAGRMRMRGAPGAGAARRRCSVSAAIFERRRTSSWLIVTPHTSRLAVAYLRNFLMPAQYCLRGWSGG